MDKDLEEILTIATLELGDNKKTLPKLKRIKSKIIEIQSNRLEKLVMPKIADVEEMQKLLGIQKTEIEKLKSLLRETYQFLSDAPELNMSNYDIDQVSELNNKMIEAYCNLNYNQSNFSA